jgi:5'-3' exonuclease
MHVHLVDGTYELFRYFYALPSHVTAAGMEVAATRGVVGTCLQLLEEGATHVGIATDHIIESFRNDLLDSYKDGSGVDPLLRAQFDLVEEVLAAAGFTVWAMVEVEADDALAAAAVVAHDDARVERAVICTPDKDLGQCVTPDGRVVQLDRRKATYFDYDGVRDKFGVAPESIPDYLGLVGDTADGIPGIPGWGAKSTAQVLARYPHYEDIPRAVGQWDVSVRGSGKLAAALFARYEDALLYRRLATVERNVDVGAVDDWRWTGPTPELAAWAERLGAPELVGRADRLAARRATN